MASVYAETHTDPPPGSEAVWDRDVSPGRRTHRFRGREFGDFYLLSDPQGFTSIGPWTETLRRNPQNQKGPLATHTFSLPWLLPLLPETPP